MSVRVQCPRCRSVCEVQPQMFGTTVKCGKCAQPFALPAAPPAQAPAAAATTAAAAPPTTAATAGAPPPAAASTATAAPPAAATATAAPPAAAAPAPPPAPAAAAPASTGGGLWGSIRNLYRSLTSNPPGSSGSSGPASAAETMRPGQPPSDDDVGLELDGPTSAALAAEQPGAKIAPPPGNSRLDVGSSTSSGLARTRNEDSHLVVQFTATNLDQRRDVALVVVADGMGGYEAGDQASAIFIRTVGGALLGHLGAAAAVQGQEKPPAALAEAIATAIKAANRIVHEQGQKPGCKGMGATAVVLVVWEGLALIGHVGDCRVYHWTGGKLRQVTKDQTLVERMVEMGKLSRAEALTHPNRNEVTQAVGRHPNIDPAKHQLEIIPGDWLIAACDGLHAHVDERLLADALRNAKPSAALLANDLVELTNRRGGSDNTTVVAVRCY